MLRALLVRSRGAAVVARPFAAARFASAFPAAVAGDFRKMRDHTNHLFATAMEEIEYAREELGTTYFADDFEVASEAVKVWKGGMKGGLRGQDRTEQKEEHAQLLQQAAVEAYEELTTNQGEEGEAARREMHMKFDQLKVCNTLLYVVCPHSTPPPFHPPTTA